MLSKFWFEIYVVVRQPITLPVTMNRISSNHHKMLDVTS